MDEEKTRPLTSDSALCSFSTLTLTDACQVGHPGCNKHRSGHPQRFSSITGGEEPKEELDDLGSHVKMADKR